MQFKPFLLSLFLLPLSLSAAPAQAAPVEIRLEQSTPAQAAEALQRATGLDVRINGGARRLVTLSFDAPRPELAVARVATALGGTWYTRLKVKEGRTAGDAPPPPRQERLVNLGLNNVTAEQAFSALARDLRMVLELEGPLQGRVSYTATRLPASDVLDRVAAVAGAQWSVGYTIDAPDLPLPPPPRPAMLEPETPDDNPETPAPNPNTPPTPGAVSPRARPRVPAVPSPTVLSGPELRLQLKAGLNALVRAGPDQRAGAVHDFMVDGERMMAMLRSLPALERDTRLRLLSSIVLPWRRLYDGLAPDVQREFKPVSEFMDRLYAATR